MTTDTLKPDLQQSQLDKINSKPMATAVVAPGPYQFGNGLVSNMPMSTWREPAMPVVEPFPVSSEFPGAENSPQLETPLIRTFESGATRDTDTDKYDYEAFLSPIVIEAYGEYMHANRIQADGGMRPGDNWQKRIPFPVLMKSLLRHVHDLWMLHRGYKVTDKKTGKTVTKKVACCAIMFNVMAYLHGLLTDELNQQKD